MENEEKEDLLVDVSESSESEVSDYCIREKIFRLLETEKQKPKAGWEICYLFIWSVLLFISSTVVLITLPIYIEQSNRCHIDTYSKFATLSTVNLVLFTLFWAISRWISTASTVWSNRLYLCLPNVLKVSLLQSIASLFVFWLADGHYVGCHLQDPLKGCVVVFSLLFYFIFSTKKTSVERVFCTITVVVGTFLTVDFGLCNRFRCRGAELPDAPDTPLRLHVLYVIGYVLALAAFAMHFTCLENCCRCSNYSSSLDMSIVSNEPPVSTARSRSSSPMPINQSLSIISGGERERHRAPLNLSLQSPPVSRTRFPVTSTPNEATLPRSWGAADWLAAHHALLWLIVALLSWLPTVGLNGQDEKLLVHVGEDLLKSLRFHTGDSDCPNLWLPSTLFIVSYILFCGTSLMLLLASRSALTVACVLMNALPMASLFWSTYKLDTSTEDLLTFNMAVTGEAISAMLGFPIIGVGTLLLLKSHRNQNTHQFLQLRLP